MREQQVVRQRERDRERVEREQQVVRQRERDRAAGCKTERKRQRERE